MPRDWAVRDTQVGWLVIAVAVGVVGWAPSVAGQQASQVLAEGRGIVVEEVGEGSALEKAGLRPGDVVHAWERQPAPLANPEGAQGTIESVFDWMWLKIEQAPRGVVRLTGQRDGKIKIFDVVPGEWKATLRARMPEGMLADYTRGKELIEAEEFEAGINLWRKVTGTAESQSADGDLMCWFLLRIGDAWSKASQWEEAHAAYRSALEAAQGPQSRESRAAVWRAIGDAHKKASEFETAREAYGSAQEIRAKIWNGSLIFASGLNDLGSLDWRQGKLDAAQGYWQRALEIRQKLAPGSLAVAGSLNNLGNLAADRGDLDRAAGYYERSLEIAQKLAPDSLTVAANLGNLGTLAYERGDLDRAAEYFEESMEIRQTLAPASLDVAMSLEYLGALARERGDLDQAAEYQEESLEIRQTLAPGSIFVEVSLGNLGTLAYERGDLDRAAEYYEGALEICQTLAPASLAEANTLGNLGILAADRGDLDRAAKYFEESLDVKQQLAPRSLAVATSLSNLGVLARRRGDLDRAAEYLKGALKVTQELAPGSLDEASVLANLGLLAVDRGDLDRAAEYFDVTLKITQKWAPGSLDMAMSLNNLGILTYKRGDLDRAAEYFEGTQEIRQRLAPGSLIVARSLNNLGVLARHRGDLDRATDYHKKALKIVQKLVPDSHEVVFSLANLGLLAVERGDLDRAAGYQKEGLEKLASGSSLETKVLYDLATTRRKQNQFQSALALFLQALQTLENQVIRLGGSRDVQAGFRAKREAYYHDAINLSLELRQAGEAFHILERSRARSFLAQFAERDLTFSDIPEELERQRRRIAWSYNKTQDEIAKLNPREQEEEVETLLTQLQQLRWDREDITEKIIQASPKLGALRYPKPLKLDDAREALDPGTVMLSYSIDEDQTHLFVLTQEGDLQVKTLPLGEKALQGEVERILELQKRRSTPHLYTKPLRQAGERLYQTLIQPAEAMIAKSERILIVPDGPLHLLPFALLVRKTASNQGHGSRDFEYLIEWKPLHSTLSATVYAELKSQRRSHPAEATDALALAAFGDPQYSSDFRPLPHSREEVNRIVALYSEGAARGFLGAKATEKQAKSVGKSARILHFATHGQFDDRFPLDSYLALTIPTEFRKDQDNGKLQAWEIFENVRIDADLVVLSACESGLGEEVFGEGLKGLTRAFQFAGARTVAATLWKVEDRATTEIMVRFYRHLGTGMPKDQALRAAQLELIRGPIEVQDQQGQVVERGLSAPYYWAAFQMIGDWR